VASWPSLDEAKRKLQDASDEVFFATPMAAVLFKSALALVNGRHESALLATDSGPRFQVANTGTIAAQFSSRLAPGSAGKKRETKPYSDSRLRVLARARSVPGLWNVASWKILALLPHCGPLGAPCSSHLLFLWVKALRKGWQLFLKTSYRNSPLDGDLAVV
jgi:hypothetical protein